MDGVAVGCARQRKQRGVREDADGRGTGRDAGGDAGGDGLAVWTVWTVVTRLSIALCSPPTVTC